jgi:hypothetical protein
MQFPQLVGRVKEKEMEYVNVRPGISLCLWYAEPVQTLAAAVADILGEYIAFIPPESLQTYLSPKGVWKVMSAKRLDSTLREMRSVGPDEYFEFHFGQEPVRNVGMFAAHFYGSPLAHKILVHEDNMLYLEFPDDFLESVSVEDLFAFVVRVGAMRQFDSGYCGYAFQHLFMSLRKESFLDISHKAMRYIGFDMSSDRFRLYARHRVCNISWLTLLGKEITEDLGGVSAVRKALPNSIKILEVGSGILIRAAEMPIVGDVNRGAVDVAPLRDIAKLTKSLRAKVENLGPDDPTFADRWMSRFDKE